jgi:hypothetical protein
MRELVFDLRGNRDVGYTARADGADIHVAARSVLGVQRAVRAAVADRFPGRDAPSVLRLRYADGGTRFEVTLR